MQFDAIGDAILTGHLLPLAAQLRIGLEVQQQRTQQETLSRQNYPVAFGDSRKNNNIKNNFTETQTEVVTPPLTSIQETLNYLTAVNVAARRGLSNGEQFWPLSMPPALSTDHHEVTLAEVTPADFMQRQVIAAKRSLTNLSVSRTHVNISFSETLFQRLYSETFHHQYGSYVEFRNAVYLKVAQGFMNYRWLLTLLFGASPVAEKNFGDKIATIEQPVRSFASSKLTAPNQVTGDYTSVEAYVSKIQADVKQQRLVNEQEFAGPVLLRGNGPIKELPRQGIYYLELRLLDLNPSFANGVDEDALTLIKLLALYFAMQSGVPVALVKTTISHAIAENEQVALENPMEHSQNEQAALDFLADLQKFVSRCQLPKTNELLLGHLREQLKTPEVSLSANLWQQTDAGSLSSWAAERAQKQMDQALAEPFKLPGLTDLSLSSQAVAQKALQSGVGVEILDAEADILQLKRQSTKQLLIGGTGSVLNPQSITEITKNKVASKRVLADAGVMVPASRTFKSANQLIAAYQTIASNGITLKGLSKIHQVVTFRLAPELPVFKQVVKKLFVQNEAVMAEETLVGASYRFLVIGGQVVAVVERIPANVVGDGRSTVQQLLANKNSRSMRGPAFEFPQSQIKLGTVEKTRLKDYRLTLDSVITRGSQILLREDATFGNGADVLDVTADMDQSYIKLVNQLASDLGLKVAGFDLILNNLYAPYDNDHPEMAVVLGVHARPFLYPHLFPMFGHSQPVADKLLAAIFANPEKN